MAEMSEGNKRNATGPGSRPLLSAWQSGTSALAQLETSDDVLEESGQAAVGAGRRR